MKINIVKRAHDYMAYVDGLPFLCESSIDAYGAIHQLIRCRPELFGNSQEKIDALVDKLVLSAILEL